LEDNVPVEEEAIFLTDTGPDPWAVVVVKGDTAPTVFAVLRPDRLLDVANGTETDFSDDDGVLSLAVVIFLFNFFSLLVFIRELGVLRLVVIGRRGGGCFVWTFLFVQTWHPARVCHFDLLGLRCIFRT
jgi:hypothetical protein